MGKEQNQRKPSDESNLNQPPQETKQPSIEIKEIYKDAILPKYQTMQSVGMDISAYCPKESITLFPGQILAIPTGFVINNPFYNLEFQVRSRSGLSLRGISVANAPGTIDPDYKEEVKVILRNDSNEEFEIKHGDRIAQLVPAQVMKIMTKQMEPMPKTRSGGFGSTGKN